MKGVGGCRVGEVQAGTTSPMHDHKGFKLQYLVNFQKYSTLRVNCMSMLFSYWQKVGDKFNCFGDNNMSMSVIVQESVIITTKLHEIPYHMINHWNNALNPFLPSGFVSGTR